MVVGEYGAYEISENGGKTWTNQLFGDGTVATVDIRAVDCLSGGLCAFVGDEGDIQRTVDGGSNWSSADPHTYQNLESISCPSAAKCVAVGDTGVIRRSEDGVCHLEQATHGRRGRAHGYAYQG